MPYGILKVDTITFTNGGVDQSITVSGIVASTSGNLTVTGTISGDVIRGGTTVSGATVTGAVGQFGNLTAVSGVFTTQISGATVTGNVGRFTSVTGGTAGFTTLTGSTVTGNIAQFTTLTGGTAGFTTVTGSTVTGTTANFTSGNFTSISGGTHTITSGVFASGTVTNPSISFVGDADTGIYASAANQVSVTTSGTERLRVDAAGQIEAVSLGSESAPVYSFTTDPNTGIYSPGADQVAISTNGSQRLLVDSSGNIGVGGAVGFGRITHGIHVTGAGTGEGIRLQTSNGSTGILEIAAESGGAVLDTRGSGYIRFNSSTTEWARFDSNGRLGLGTSSPTANAHVSSADVGATTLKVSNTSTGGADWTFYSTGQSASEGAGKLLIHSGSPRVTIDTSGRVGIGVTGPQALLHCETTGQELARFNSSNVNGGYLSVQSSGTNVIYIGSAATLSSGTSTQGTVRTQSDLLFATGGGSERARIDSSGRLLVGTSTARTNFFNTTQSANIQLEGTSGTALMSLVANADAVGGNAGLTIGKTRGTTVGSTTIVQSGDVLGRVSFQGSDGTDFVQAADITAEVDGTPGANDMPGRLVFSTTADGASSPTSRIIINSAGTLFPATDNTYQAGSAGYRWTAIYAVNGTIQTSDAREKRLVEQSSLGSDFIRALKPVSYKWKVGGNVVSKDENNEDVITPVEGQRTHWGFIAQEVREAADAAGVDFGGWILTDKDDPESQQGLRYDQFIAPLTKALQEALAEIDVLKTKVAALEAS